MTYRPATALAIILLLNFIPLNAQDEKFRHFGIGAGFAYSGLRDSGLSPLWYSGNHGFFTSELRLGTGKRINLFQAGFITGKMAPAINPDYTSSEFTNLKGEVYFYHMRNIVNPDRQIRIYLGGSAGVKSALYEHNLFVNSSLTNYSIGSLDISMLFAFPITAGNEHLLEFRFRMPLAAMIVRPSFAYIRPEGFLDHSTEHLYSIFNSIRFYTMDKYTGLNTGISLKLPLGRRHGIRMNYDWEYFGHVDSNPLKSATHGLSLQLALGF